MKVKIKTSSLPSFWYHDYIGDIFNVKECESENHFRVQKKDLPERFKEFKFLYIEKKDSVVQVDTNG